MKQDKPTHGADPSRRLTIFVHRASALLTDHASHGDGLICFSLLNGLAERGHTIYAYADHVDIHACSPRLQTRSEPHRTPANSLISWEHTRRAERWLRQLSRTEPIDLVWRMHPYTGPGYPDIRRLQGLPLVIGPLYYNWAAALRAQTGTGRPRFSISLGRLIDPVAARGWKQAQRNAKLLIASTPAHAAALRREVADVEVIDLPVIVEPASEALGRRFAPAPHTIGLIFVANLAPHKNPRIFCEIVGRLRAQGIAAQGILIGDGPERAALEEYGRTHGLQSSLCFVGRVPNSEVYRRIAQADLLISLSDGEPYGRSIVEAMAVGTPGVCHRSGGPADFIESGVDGLLVDRLNAEDYVEAIGRVAVDPSLWMTLSTQARAKAAGWTSDIVLSRLEAALQHAVQRTSSQ